MTRAAEQLQGVDRRWQHESEPDPPRAQDAEAFLLGELAGQMLEPLGRRDRWRVRRAVRRGRAVSDVRSASAAVAVALCTQRDLMTTVPLRRRWALFLGPGLVTLAQVMGLVDDTDGLTAVRAIGFFFCAAWITSTVLPVVQRPGRAARAARAEELNRALLPPVVPPVG